MNQAFVPIHCLQYISSLCLNEDIIVGAMWDCREFHPRAVSCKASIRDLLCDDKDWGFENLTSQYYS